MTTDHFNAFYKPYLKATKVKNIYRNIARHNHPLVLAVFFITPFIIFTSAFYFIMCQDHKISSFLIFIFSITLLCLLDKKTSKNAIRQLRKSYKIKFLVLPHHGQIKYYLWMDALKDMPSFFSVEKALSYLEIELSKLNSETTIPPEYLIILSGITFTAFWKFYDIINLPWKNKAILCLLIIYASYRFIFFKLYVFPNKKSKLLEFKHNLQRLASELS